MIKTKTKVKEAVNHLKKYKKTDSAKDLDLAIEMLEEIIKDKFTIEEHVYVAWEETLEEAKAVNLFMEYRKIFQNKSLLFNEKINHHILIQNLSLERANNNGICRITIAGQIIT